ncbi:MAG: MSHA biogenesis protein MshK [Burkholderiaceae bacterium]|nr:MAG: MSHA biogenesis protein MshK [Burkholderiaceae bacterium]
MARLMKHVVSSIYLMALTSLVSAQEFKDPTRPAISTNQQAGESELEHVPVLQSILISPTRKFAVIDGKTVRLHAKFGDQVLVKLSETEAVLKRGREVQVLKLFPGVEKELIRKSAKSINN